MSEGFAKWVARIPEALRPWALLASACGIGFTTALVLVGFMGIPEQVSANTQAIQTQSAQIFRNTEAIREQQRTDSIQMSMIVRGNCILTAMATKRDPVEACGL